jgi:hypothetical protein
MTVFEKSFNNVIKWHDREIYLERVVAIAESRSDEESKVRPPHATICMIFKVRGLIDPEASLKAGRDLEMGTAYQCAMPTLKQLRSALTNPEDPLQPTAWKSLFETVNIYCAKSAVDACAYYQVRFEYPSRMEITPAKEQSLEL